MSINKDVKVSIIVAAYNVEKFIKDCIESIITQTYSNFELIIVNDGSNDSSGAICNSFAKNDARIKVVHQENKGLVNARKSGLQIASGKYVLYIDGDDYVESNFCELLIMETYNFDADIVIGGYIRNYRGRMITVKNILPAGRYENDKTKKIWDKMIFTGNFFSHGISTYSWGKLFKRDILISIQMAIPSNITIGEDAACVYPYISICKKIVITNASNYHYVQHQSSMLKNSSNISEEINKLSRLFVYFLNFFKAHEFHDRYYNQLKPYLLSQLMIRTGGLIKTDGKNYLIGHQIFNIDKIAIYNSGTFGQKIFYRLLSENFKNITWIDEDADLCNQDKLPVQDPSVLKSINVDKVFIASLNPVYINKIQKQLEILGFDNIIQCNLNDNIDNLISLYGLDPFNFDLKLN